MKHPYFRSLFFLFLSYSGNLAAQNPDSCGCMNCPYFIPDNFVGEFYYQVHGVVNNDLHDSLQGVSGVHIHFDHEYLGDLQMRLFSPAGQFISLVGPIGFFGSNDFTDWNVGFVPCGTTAAPDPGFTTKWNNNQPWGLEGFYTGLYYPYEGCLEEFDTGAVNGTWRLEITDGQAVDMGNLYEFEVFFRDTTGMTCASFGPLLPVAQFTVTTDGWQAFWTNESIRAQSYSLTFGDGSHYGGLNLPTTHTFADTGNYVVQLIAINSFGRDTAEQVIHIDGKLPSASGINVLQIAGCQPVLINFAAGDAENVDTYHWLFPGAIPEESLLPSPQVRYDTTGLYPVTLILSNALGMDTLYDSFYVQVLPGLSTPGFTVTVQGDSIIATNTTQGFSQFSWSLNGEAASNVSGQQQIFTVDSSGIYLISLFVASACDSALVEQSVPVILSSLKNAWAEQIGLNVWPNPTEGRCRLEMVSAVDLPDAVVELTNLTGQVFYNQRVAFKAGKNSLELDLGNLSHGFYLLRLQTDRGTQSVPLLIQR
ncbi:MAG: PKD domain-containing protein [Saprospiraceae bacterium]